MKAQSCVSEGTTSLTSPWGMGWALPSALSSRHGCVNMLPFPGAPQPKGKVCGG